MIECQYRNEGKDIEATEQAYLDEGISTLWLDRDAFDLTCNDVDLDREEWTNV